jgi:acetyl esterase
MPVAPPLRAYLDQAAALDLPPLDSQPLDVARASALTFAEAGAKPPEPVSRVEDLELATDAGRVPARLYAPATTERPPIVAYLHGGGWVFMGIETHDRICRRLANASGALVVSVEYRLAPEHPFPAPLDDCRAATRWLATRGADVGGDPTRLAVAGDSAGGNLGAAVALHARDDGPALAAAALVYPVCDAACDAPSYEANRDGYLLTAHDMHWFWRCYLGSSGDPADPLASPLRAPDLAGLPPTLVVTAEYDPLRDEGEAYADRLEAAGVPVERRRFDGMLHGFLGMDALVPEADQAMALVGGFLRTRLSD